MWNIYAKKDKINGKLIALIKGKEGDEDGDGDALN